MLHLSLFSTDERPFKAAFVNRNVVLLTLGDFGVMSRRGNRLEAAGMAGV